MKIYLVGGAVRDSLLGLSVKDKDWVVVGSDIKTLLDAGFQQVGADFPVFLHPKTHEEYALARTERKTTTGHTGFVCDFTPNVTLEEDLLRRDLTINAMALSADGILIDPYDGLRDLKQRILRHVSNAFAEDPLRVLRIARFAARFHSLGFHIATNTQKLMCAMVANNELKTLTAERIWIEWQKSLSSERPDIFLRVLKECGALADILPEIEAQFSVYDLLPSYRTKSSSFAILWPCRQVAQLTSDLSVRFAVQLHLMSQSLTPDKHVAAIKALCKRIKVPNVYRDSALMVAKEHLKIGKVDSLNARDFITLFNNNDCWRKPEKIKQLTLACQAIYQQKNEIENKTLPLISRLKEAFDVANLVEVKPIVKAGFKGSDIRDELTRQQIEAVHQYLAQRS